MRRPLPSAACNVHTNLHLAARLIPPMQFEPTNSSLSDAQDILYHIVQYLDPDRSSAEDLARVRQTLLSTAISCRNFTRPALAALWRFLPSDKPLTDLLVTLGLAEYSAFLDGSHPSPLALKLKGSAVSVSSAVNRMKVLIYVPWACLPYRIHVHTLNGADFEIMRGMFARFVSSLLWSR